MFLVSTSVILINKLSNDKRLFWLIGGSVSNVTTNNTVKTEGINWYCNIKITLILFLKNIGEIEVRI